jgi:hypothetical protein
MRDRLGIDSPMMGPSRSTKVLGKWSVQVELDYSITPGYWVKPLLRRTLWIVASYHAISTNKQTNTSCARLVHPGGLQPQISLHHSSCYGLLKYVYIFEVLYCAHHAHHAEGLVDSKGTQGPLRTCWIVFTFPIS